MNSIFSRENNRNFSPYNLKGGGESSGIFYLRLESFTEVVTTEGMKRFKGFILEKQEIEVRRKQCKQTIEEDLLDLLIVGTLWNNYKGRWSNRISFQYPILNTLFTLRNKFPSIKHSIDQLRGKLMMKWLDKVNDLEIEPTLKNIERLNLWLKATGDFKEEAKRIQSLIIYLKELPLITQLLIIDEIIEFADWFKDQSEQVLGNYTSDVKEFLTTNHPKYKGREDFFFCGRKEVEYHLNMVGAAIMNKALRNDFLKAENKIVLLPTCMAINEDCKAKSDGIALRCAHCTKGCNISVTANRMKEIGVDTILLKHSSDFSKWLLPWANQTNTALIGTACVLNLLQGGYEMKRLQIPSQCIFLDYCGCKKHWDTKGNPTSINIDQLKTVICIDRKNGVSPITKIDKTTIKKIAV